MKWLVIIAIVIVIAAALWLRSARTTGSSATQRPHRLDDSMSVVEAAAPRVEPARRPEAPPSAVSEEPPGSDFAHEPEIVENDENPSAASGSSPTP